MLMTEYKRFLIDLQHADDYPSNDDYQLDPVTKETLMDFMLKREKLLTERYAQFLERIENRTSQKTKSVVRSMAAATPTEEEYSRYDGFLPDNYQTPGKIFNALSPEDQRAVSLYRDVCTKGHEHYQRKLKQLWCVRDETLSWYCKLNNLLNDAIQASMMGQEDILETYTYNQLSLADQAQLDWKPYLRKPHYAHEIPDS